MGLLKQRWFRVVIGMPLAAMAAGGAGFGIGLAGQAIEGPVPQQTPPPPGPVPADLHKYTHSSSGCEGWSHVDPINVLFVADGRPDWIADHMSHHGWGFSGILNRGSIQYFGDNVDGGSAECSEQEGSRASAGFPFCIPPCTRFHARYYTHKDADGAPRQHPLGFGQFASSDAHHEQRVDCGGPNHAVDSDSGSFDINGELWWGGFNAGREEIRRLWVETFTPEPIPAPPPGGGEERTGHQHEKLRTEMWDNTDQIEQCNGWLASSDGRVYYIGVKA